MANTVRSSTRWQMVRQAEPPLYWKPISAMQSQAYSVFFSNWKPRKSRKAERRFLSRRPHMMSKDVSEQALAYVNTYSSPSELRITDMRFVDIVGAPMHCTLLKLYTNQGLVGFGEVRDGASKTYAL